MSAWFLDSELSTCFNCNLHHFVASLGGSTLALNTSLTDYD